MWLSEQRKYVEVSDRQSTVSSGCIHRIEVMVSFDDFPNKASLKTTGYLPGLDKSIDPEATVVMMLKSGLFGRVSKDTKVEVGGMWIKIDEGWS